MAKFLCVIPKKCPPPPKCKPTKDVSTKGKSKYECKPKIEIVKNPCKLKCEVKKDCGDFGYA
jgi:hypothetical protein